MKTEKNNYHIILTPTREETELKEAKSNQVQFLINLESAKSIPELKLLIKAILLRLQDLEQH
jgi:hypothetical protein